MWIHLSLCTVTAIRGSNSSAVSSLQLLSSIRSSLDRTSQDSGCQKPNQLRGGVCWARALGIVLGPSCGMAGGVLPARGGALQHIPPYQLFTLPHWAQPGRAELAAARLDLPAAPGNFLPALPTFDRELRASSAATLALLQLAARAAQESLWDRLSSRISRGLASHVVSLEPVALNRVHLLPLCSCAGAGMGEGSFPFSIPLIHALNTSICNQCSQIL